jgi:hypothetical protein
VSGTLNDSSFPAGERRKLGFALAGGGLRASLFHLGVLHRLAQLDLLRRVEVLSTVSGGSIIGALYMLLLKRARLIDPTSGRAVSGEPRRLGKQDYIDLVWDLDRRLSRAIGLNLRNALFWNPLGIVRVLFTPYTLGERMVTLAALIGVGWGLWRGRASVTAVLAALPVSLERLTVWDGWAVVPAGRLVVIVAAAGFPGDAEWGTWRRALDNPDFRQILAGTDFYKIGHHGSHNATPVEFVEQVLGSRFHAMASVTHVAQWPKIPKRELVERLAQKSGGKVARSDQPDRAGSAFVVSGDGFIDAVVTA